MYILATYYRNFVISFSKFAELWIFFTKFLCMCQDHIFQVEKVKIHQIKKNTATGGSWLSWLWSCELCSLNASKICGAFFGFVLGLMNGDDSLQNKPTPTYGRKMKNLYMFDGFFLIQCTEYKSNHTGLVCLRVITVS